MSSMPEQKPGRSEQVVCTPPAFIAAVECRLAIDEEGFPRDLAASPENTIAPEFFTEEQDSLVQSWTWNLETKNLWNWCNPPYSNIEPWVAKASIESQRGAHIAMLVPASTGSNWWAKYVAPSAYITYLNGRITFVGHKSPYPKDLVLLLYTPFLVGGSCVWRWNE